MLTNLPGFVTWSCAEGHRAGWNSHYSPQHAFLFLMALLTAWPLSDICLHVYLLFTPTEREPHGNTDLLCPTGAVFSAARRIPNAEGTRCVFAGYVFHISFILKFWSLKERRKRYFKVIQNHTLHSGITNNCKTPTLTKGTKSIGGILGQDPGRHKTVAPCRRWIANQLEAETDLIRYPTEQKLIWMNCPMAV